MNTKTIRAFIPAIVLIIAGIAYVAHTGFGDLSAIGWGDISILCPLGALGTMLASKTIVPRAIISLVLAIVAIIIFGRAFCAWICPTTLISKLRYAFSKPEKVEGSQEVATEDIQLSEKELAMLKSGCGQKICSAEERPSNSRYIILGSALLSAAIFGFPVFCLICPIGLSFALVFVLIALFGAGDVTWSCVLIPVLLLVEVVFFRKWCSHLCPLSALMSLVGKANRTFRPTIDHSKCIESRGGKCGRCGQVCEVGIDPRHPENGAAWSECTKCRTCVESCPAGAISMPFLMKSSSAQPIEAKAAEE